MNQALHTVSVNHWFLASLILTFRFMAAGAAWIWLFPTDNKNETSAYGPYLTAAAKSLIPGSVFSILSVMFLAEFGLYTPFAEWLALVFFIACGLGLARFFRPSFNLRQTKTTLPGICVFFLLSATAMNIPESGEWILGGWDPGVYQNQGIHIARTGTFHPEPVACYRELSDEAFQSFTRGNQDYRECFTGIPIDPETRQFQNDFFRLTPSLTAIAARAGGLRAAVRLNYFAAIMVLFLFTGMLWENTKNSAHVLFALGLLITQPLWLYHIHVPVSEMLQLSLFCGLGFLLSPTYCKTAPRTAAAVILFAGIVNRLSFIPFAGVYVLILAILDTTRSNRKMVLIERVLQIAAIAGATLWNWTFCSVPLVRFREIFPKLILVATVSAGIAIAFDLAGGKKSFQRFLQKISYPILLGMILTAITAMGLIYFSQQFEPISRLWQAGSGMAPNLDKLIGKSSELLQHVFAYMGKATVCVAAGGLLLLFAGKKSSTGNLKPAILFFCSLFAVVAVKGYIVRIFPWATRRYLPSAVPLVTITAGYLLSKLWSIHRKPRLLFRIISVVLLIALVYINGARIKNAASSTQYEDASEILQMVAAQISDDEIIVVDHSWWGTPLTFIYGKQVLNGQYFFERRKSEGKETMSTALNALRRFREQGYTVKFLTSTRTAALDIYPIKVSPATLEWESEQLSLDEIKHSSRAYDYKQNKKKMKFRLFTFGNNK